MTERPDGQVSLFDRNTWYGRTSLAPCPAIKAATSRQSSKKQSASQSRKPPIFQCLTRDGRHGGGFRDVDGRWSVAWRVLDSQWWGVPQRRRRIALVADFGGTSAHEILFNAKGVYGHPEAGGKAREGSAESAENRASCTVRICGGCDGGGKGTLVQEERSGTIKAQNDQTLFQNTLTPWDSQTNRVYGQDGVFPSISAREKAGMDRQSVFCIPINDKATRFSGGGDTRKDDGAGNGLGVGHDGDPSPTITAADRHGVYCAGFKLGNSENARSIGYSEELAPTLNADCGGNKPAVLDMSHANDVIRECGSVVPTLQSRMGTGGNQVPLTYQKIAGTLSPGAHAGSYNGQDAYNDMLICSAERPGSYECAPNGIVRRLTPLECERLQGFPDGWTDIGAWTDEKGKLHKESSDSARYKALGNSIALPPWKWVLKRLCAQYERDATMGSLFDGIGGFPLIWMQLNGWSSVKWASEIEPFCIAVTKRHFGDENGDGDAWKYLTGGCMDGCERLKDFLKEREKA